MGSMVSGIAEAKHESQVAVVLNAMGYEIEQLAKKVACLENRITTILRSSQPASIGNEKSPTCSVGLALSLGSKVDEIRSISSLVSDLIDRIEL